MNVSGTADKVLKSTCRMCHGGCSTLLHVKDEQDRQDRGRSRRSAQPRAAVPDGRREPGAGLQPRAPDASADPRRRARRRQMAAGLVGRGLRPHLRKHPRDLGQVRPGRHRHRHRHRTASHALGAALRQHDGNAELGQPGHGAVLLPARQHHEPDLRRHWRGAITAASACRACCCSGATIRSTSSPDGEVGFQVRDALKANPKIIVVDPRRTWLAKQAHVFLQLRPGTDDALALAMLNVIIEDEALRQGISSRNGPTASTGSPSASSRYTPEWAEPITWVPAREDPRRGAAVDRGAARRARMGLRDRAHAEHHPDGAGDLDASGAHRQHRRARAAGASACAPSRRSRSCPRCCPRSRGRSASAPIEFRVLSGAGSRVPSAHMPSVFKSMRTGDPYWTKGFLVFGNNALSTYADSRLVYESLMKLDLLMVADLFMTPTCELADVVLPAAAWPELDQIVGMPYFGEDVVLAQQKAVQIGECRQDEVIMTELARRLGLPHCDDEPARHLRPACSRRSA